MEMTGERRIPAPRQQVWDALNDPEVLRASIPGCESVERVGDDAFQAKVGIKIGPMSAKFGGKVKLENLNPPTSYTISGEGQGGAMGFAKGGADVALADDGLEATVLTYNVKAQVGGKMAQLGARLIDSTAKSMADQFFNRFTAHFTPPLHADAPPVQPVGVTPVEAATTVAGMSTMQSPDRPMAPNDPASQAAVRNTDTEFLGHGEAAEGVGPLTQHGAEGPSAGGGKPVHRPNVSPAAPGALRPLRTMTTNPLGLPLQFWLGSAAFLVVLYFLYLT